MPKNLYLYRQYLHIIYGGTVGSSRSGHDSCVRFHKKINMSAVMASGSPGKRHSVLVLSTVFVPKFQVTFFTSV